MGKGRLKAALGKISGKLQGTQLGENLESWAKGEVPTKVSADKGTMTMVYVGAAAIVVLAIAMFTRKK